MPPLCQLTCRAALSVTAILLVSAYCRGAVLTDWTSVDTVGDVALGNLQGNGVTLTGIDIPPGSVINGTSGRFNYPFFTPQLATTDEVRVQVKFNQTSNFNLAFDNPITDPVLHISSLASTLTFSGSTIARVSGQPSFSVSGNTVSGSVAGGFPNDSNGTIQFLGTYSSIPFPNLCTTLNERIWG